MAVRTEETGARLQALLQHPDPAALREWARIVPETDLLRVAGQLDTLMRGLQGAHLLLADAIACHEALRDRLVKVVRGLTLLYVKNPSLEADGMRDRLQACFDLLQLEASTCQGLLARGLAEACDTATLGLLLHRTMAAQIYQQVMHYQLYLPIPGKEWLKLHKLFHLAVQRKLNTFSAADAPLFPFRDLSVNNLYIIALLLGCARLNKLLPEQIVQVCQALQQWVPLVRISPKPHEHERNQLVVDITSGAAPAFFHVYKANEKSVMCYLHVTPLIDRLTELQQQPLKGGTAARSSAAPAWLKDNAATGGVDAVLLSHLKSAWSEYVYREERVAVEETVDVCVGLAAAHFYLCGGKDLKSFIGEKLTLSIVYEDHEDQALIKRQRSQDIWSAFVFTPEGDVKFGQIPPQYRFQRDFRMDDDHESDPRRPFHAVKALDRSAHGFRLEWPTGTRQHIEVGEFIGIRTGGDYHWQVGVIAWVDHRENGVMRTGVRLLSPEAIPVAVDVPMHLATNENCLPGILLPAIPGFSDQVTLIVPPEIYQPGHFVSVSQKGIEQRVKLAEPVRQTRDSVQFECGFLMHKPSAHPRGLPN